MLQELHSRQDKDQLDAAEAESGRHYAEETVELDQSIWD